MFNSSNTLYLTARKLLRTESVASPAIPAAALGDAGFSSVTDASATPSRGVTRVTLETKEKQVSLVYIVKALVTIVLSSQKNMCIVIYTKGWKPLMSTCGEKNTVTAHP